MNPALLHKLAIRIFAFWVLVFLTLASLPPLMAIGQDLSSSPLPKCPDSPNCVHQVHSFPIAASSLSDMAGSVLVDMDAESIQKGTIDGHAIDAVFKAFVFRDDLQIYIVPAQEGSLLYIRSASREGYYDLGVNKRRVRRFLKKLNRAISDAS